MTGDILLYLGSIIIFIWGVAHIAPVSGVVRSFGEISEHNRRIITMTWVSEGLFLCFIGVLVFLAASICETNTECAKAVIIASAAMLVLSAFWTALTGARTPPPPMKLCPFIKIIAAACCVLGITI